MNAVAEPDRPHVSRTPFVNGRNNGLRFMIDAGAEVSLMPPKLSDVLHSNRPFLL